jgi:hypothetical protein
MVESMSAQASVSELNDEIRKLKIENERLQSKLEGKCVPMSDAAVDGVVATILIAVATCALVVWLSSMPS